MIEVVRDCLCTVRLNKIENTDLRSFAEINLKHRIDPFPMTKRAMLYVAIHLPRYANI